MGHLHGQDQGGTWMHGLGNVGTWQMSHRQNGNDLSIAFPSGKLTGTSQRDMLGA